MSEQNSATAIAGTPSPESEIDRLRADLAEAHSQGWAWRREAERLEEVLSRVPEEGPPQCLSDVKRWLDYHRNTHLQWASWFEKHPNDPRAEQGVGNAAHHRECERRYTAMITCVETAEQALASARRDALEEAAKVADEFHPGSGSGRSFVAGRLAETIATAIRALTKRHLGGVGP